MDFFEKTFYLNTVKDWSIAFGLIILSILVARAVHWFINKILKPRAEKSKTILDDLVYDMIEEPLVFTIALAGSWYSIHMLTIAPRIEALLGKAYYFLIIIAIAWSLVRIVDALIREYLVPLVEKSESDLDDQLLPILRKTIRAAIWIIAVVVGLDNAGYDVGALLAGLGIGGLALALAAQDTVKNLFGGIMIFVDKPFKIKDRVKVGGFDGSITEIGLRSTRLTTLEGRMVTIPNSTFTSSFIENISSEPSRKIILNLGLTYDMDETKLERAMSILDEIAKEHTENYIEETFHIGFNAFNDFSLNIIFVYFITPGANILEAQTKINLQILKRFNAEGLDFAFPTQTILTKQA